jgi:ABC-type glycerol-3-phosphate transport system permease component
MSEPLVVCLISVAANVAGMLAIYSVMAHRFACLAWRGRGVLSVIATIVVAQLFWIAPALLIIGVRNPDNVASYGLWFGNWLVSAFAVVLLWRTATCIPRQLEDSARLDGLGAFGTWRHAVMPFVKGDLVLISILTVMATLLPFWGFVTEPDAGNSIVIYQRFLSPSGRIAMMTGASLLGALPVIAVFFLGRASPRLRGD